MSLTRVFSKGSKWLYVYLIVLGILKSILASSVLYFISRKINNDMPSLFFKNDWLIFVLLLGASFFFAKQFQDKLIRLSRDIAYNFGISIIQKIRIASLKSMEEIGSEKIYMTLNDVGTISEVPKAVIELFNALVIVTACSIYLMYISFINGLVLVGLMFLLLFFYIFRDNVIGNNLSHLHDLGQNNFRFIEDLLKGFKQLKNNRVRKRNLYEAIDNNFLEIKEARQRVAKKYLNNYLWGSYSWYGLIGLLLYFPGVISTLSQEQSLTYIVTVLYLMGPVGVIIDFQPTYANLTISLARLSNLENQLTSVEKDDDFLPPPNNNEQQLMTEPFRSMKVDKILYRYAGENKGERFQIGPTTLEIKKGEVVFIIGGNGSGKTTFVKLLSGLYTPDSGNVYYNEKLMDRHLLSRHVFRFSYIFNDHHFFSRNYDDFNLSADNTELNRLCDLFRLNKIITILREEGFVYGHRLSKGEQKRLSLILTLLENKEIIILDEWAAEQDPPFKLFFYKNLLPYFKSLGKTVIVVSHDNDFFSHADRVFKFDYGIATEIKINTQSIVEN